MSHICIFFENWPIFAILIIIILWNVCCTILVFTDNTYFRLRVHILEISQGGIDFSNMRQELISFDQIRNLRPKYSCCIPGCPFQTVNYKKYLDHLSFLHQNGKTRLSCNYKNSCSREFSSLEMLRKHYTNFHRKKWGVYQ